MFRRDFGLAGKRELTEARPLQPVAQLPADRSRRVPPPGKRVGFFRAILNDEERLDVAAAERDILAAGDALLAKDSDIGAILLECTNMVPYARVLSQSLRLPVFSIYTYVTWFQAALAPRGFGWPAGVSTFST